MFDSNSIRSALPSENEYEPEFNQWFY